MEIGSEKQDIILNISKKSGKKKFLGVLILGGIPLLFITYLVLGPILDILRKDISAKDMYVISEYVNVRSTSDANSLKMGHLTYGEKVLVYEIKDDWAEVLVDGRKVFLASKFLVEPAVYFTIEGIFGDERAAKLIKNSKYRLALYQYFKQKGFMGEIPEDILHTQFSDSTFNEVYQIISEPKGSLYNSTVFADFNGDFRQDAAFILKKKGGDDKILVIFSFDKDDASFNSKVIFETELEESWMAARLVKKGTTLKLEQANEKDSKLKLPVNGILISSNRSKSLGDPILLIYYDGKNFVNHTLKKEK